MSDEIDELELAVWKRRARRWTIGLTIQLTVNTALVALALGGFGADHPQFPASVAAPPALPQKAAAKIPVRHAAPKIPDEEPTPAQPLKQLRELIIERPAISMAEEPPPAPPPPPPPPPSAPPPPMELEVSAAEPAGDWLLVANPAGTGGPVHLAVDGTVYRLEPGEYCRFTASREHRVAYHRGDNFGYASHGLMGGTHAFEVGEAGWKLKPLAPDAARQIVDECRLQAAPLATPQTP